MNQKQRNARIRAQVRAGRFNACTHRSVLTSLHHAMRQVGIPVKYWDREDMICLKSLIREMRQVIWDRWLVMPVIREGDTVAEIVSAVVRARNGGFERRIEDAEQGC